MKRLILPLLLLLAIGMLVAAESPASDVVGYVKYECISGVNFVALPLDQGFTFASEVGDFYSGAIDQISRWDVATQSWENAVFYDLGDGFTIWDPDFEVEAGSVNMINALEPVNFYSLGNMPIANAQYSLTSGINTLMVPLNKADITLSSELGDDIGSVDVISRWDALSQSWENAVFYDLGEGFTIWDPDFDVSIGMPVMVNAFEDTTWPNRSLNVNFGLTSENRKK